MSLCITKPWVNLNQGSITRGFDHPRYVETPQYSGLTLSMGLIVRLKDTGP
nr:MAG TPA: hypothetical protein [Caudoviricetes sp.]